MAGTSETVNIPTKNIENAIFKIAKQEKFVDFCVTMGSASRPQNCVESICIVFHVKIEENGKGENKQPLHLIFKTPPGAGEAIRNDLPINKYYGMEAHAYSVMFPALNILQEDANIPEDQCFKFLKCFGCSSQNFLEFLALDDLTVRGFRMFNPLKSCDHDHMKLLVKTLANYHALSYAMREKQPATFRQLSEVVIKSQNYKDTIVTYLEEAFANSENSTDPLSADRVKKLTVKLLAILDDYFDFDGKDTTYSIITHGDCWYKNFMYNYEVNKMNYD